MMNDIVDKGKKNEAYQNVLAELLGIDESEEAKQEHIINFFKDRFENKYLIEEELFLDNKKIEVINELIKGNEQLIRDEIDKILENQKNDFEKIWGEIKSELYSEFLNWLIYSDIIDIIKLEIQYLYIAKIKVDQNFTFTKLKGKYILYDINEESFQIDYKKLPSLILKSVKKIEFMLKIFVERNSDWLEAFMKLSREKSYGTIHRVKPSLETKILRAVNQLRTEKKGRIIQEDIAKKLEIPRSTLLDQCSKEKINLNELIPKK